MLCIFEIRDLNINTIYNIIFLLFVNKLADLINTAVIVLQSMSHVLSILIIFDFSLFFDNSIDFSSGYNPDLPPHAFSPSINQNISSADSSKICSRISFPGFV